MTNEATIEKMQQMRLNGMLNAFRMYPSGELHLSKFILNA